jgi:DNA repair protein RecN (Recombination protein N)
MKRKYGPSVEKCLQTLEESKQRLQDLENREQRLADLENELASATLTLTSAGKALREARQSAGTSLGKEILDQLQDLGFPHARFHVAVEKAEPGPAGGDIVDFMFAPNPGEDMRSLKDIASSGEISRVMLAIKTLMAGHDQIPVMVFDEIDANVGGEMGHAIGSKMRKAGETRQVLAITHLPQVAVHGACHLAVSKEVVDGRTFTRVKALFDEERVEEIARMLGGTAKASLSRDHARELLRNA